jgi:hypothetical protein
MLTAKSSIPLLLFDIQECRQADEAWAFLLSPDCKRLTRLAGIRWTVGDDDIDQAVQRLGKKRTRCRQGVGVAERKVAKPGLQMEPQVLC